MSPEAGARRLALKVDCDTYEGTQRGIPSLLRLFDAVQVRASFYFTLGPDRSGRAVRRLFTQRGFLQKMLRSNAVSLYGPRTMLYGTLLPSPRIGARLGGLLRAVEAAGHEVAVHAWDHVRWHDRLHRLGEAEIERDYSRAHDAFAQIFGRRARASAAPGWHATAASLAVQERYDLLYASDTRGGTPCLLEAGGRRFRTLEIPTTLPTWDEMLGSAGCPDAAGIVEHYRAAIRGTEVHSIHTEVEGTARFQLFERQMRAWLADGVRCITLEELAREALASHDRLPMRSLLRSRLPNRAGQITTSAG